VCTDGKCDTTYIYKNIKKWKTLHYIQKH
jgi:hypothetical protein